MTEYRHVGEIEKIFVGKTVGFEGVTHFQDKRKLRVGAVKRDEGGRRGIHTNVCVYG